MLTVSKYLSRSDCGKWVHRSCGYSRGSWQWLKRVVRHSRTLRGCLRCKWIMKHCTVLRRRCLWCEWIMRRSTVLRRRCLWCERIMCYGTVGYGRGGKGVEYMRGRGKRVTSESARNTMAVEGRCWWCCHKVRLSVFKNNVTSEEAWSWRQKEYVRREEKKNLTM